MKDPQQIVNALMWVVVAGLGFAILCTIIYYTVYRKRLPCIEDEHRKLMAALGKNLVEEKEKEMFTSEKMPELKAGDVCYGSIGIWYLCVSPAHLYALRRDDERGEVGLMYHTTISKLSCSIGRVYRREGYFDIGGGGGGLYNLLSDPNSEKNLSALIWTPKPSVREMTVEQIEEQLGYKIKVVGNNSKGE